MSFYGATIKRGDSLSLQAADAELVHLSNLVLVGEVKTGDQFRVSVADENKKEYVAAILSDQHLQHTCDLYLSAGAQVSFTQSSGKNSKVEVHLTGYTEPADLVSEDDGDATDSGEESLDDSAKAKLAKQVQAYLKNRVAPANEEESDEEASDDQEASDASEEIAETELRASIERKIKKAKKEESEEDNEDNSDDEENASAQEDGSASSEESEVEEDSATAKKKAEAAIAKIQAAVDSSEDEEADSDDEEADSDDEDAMEEKAPAAEVVDSSDESADENEEPVAQVDSSDDSQEDDEESSEEEQPKKPAPKKGGKQQPKKEEVAAAANDKKRKATGTPETSPPPKKAATGGDAYETAVVEFVKAAGGSCKISHIGARVKKPADFKGKLGQWLKDRTKTFKVSGDSVSLVAKK